MDNVKKNDSVKFLRGESDYFVGRRGSLKRYLVCSMEGHFPVLIKTCDNSLAVAYRIGGVHVSISGTIAISISNDGGVTWSDPNIILPRFEDNINPAFGINSSGEMVAAFWKAGLHCYMEDPAGNGIIYDRNWTKSIYRDERKNTPGLFIIKSKDNGSTWTNPLPYISELLSVAIPHGKIIIAPDGTMIMSAYGLLREPSEGYTYACIIVRSIDNGETWSDETLVARGYNETTYIFLPDSTLIAAARSDSGYVATIFSEDMGRTWRAPVQITRKGEHPADIILLRSGKLLLTYGRRIRPMGCGALLSDDGGKTWNYDREVLIAGDGVEDGDLGYPSTVQLENGNIVTVLYYASGSEMSKGHYGWGRTSCQAIHYREDDINR